ncbi:hypothetical protein [Microbacterium sp. NIBRBAC000506063]|uniref:hypothetical protein n=1 Tax=Microbacterium sp. NIBRBAC000506063 TaxID=2734618 RepID=UPI002948C0DB|nr:hypothetical protein [Microbacterium sp. NIBRBAC000506063]
MISRVGVAVMGAALLLYVVVAAWLAVQFLLAGTPAGIGMGIALAVLAPLGGWALARELVFGFQADRLGRTLEAEGGMPAEEVALTPSGRVVKDEASPLVAKYAEAAASDDDWRAHYRLGIVQDAAGERKEARASIREAIRRERAARSA